MRAVVSTIPAISEDRERRMLIERLQGMIHDMPAGYLEDLLECILEDCIRLALSEDDMKPCSLSHDEQALIAEFRHLPNDQCRSAVLGTLKEFAAGLQAGAELDGRAATEVDAPWPAEPGERYADEEVA